jgi:hypothetical protein
MKDKEAVQRISRIPTTAPPNILNEYWAMDLVIDQFFIGFYPWQMPGIR